MTHGQQPVVQGHASASEEYTWIVDQVQTIADSGVQLSDICIVARTRKLRDEVGDHLSAQGIRVFALNQGGDNRNLDGVRLATMHRVKGLEFHYFFLAGLNQNVVPLRIAASNSEDPVELRQNELNERALVHVAASRAVKGLFVSWHGNVSPFLTGLN